VAPAWNDAGLEPEDSKTQRAWSYGRTAMDVGCVQLPVKLKPAGWS